MTDDRFIWNENDFEIEKKEKSNIDESHLGLSRFDAALLYEVETNGAHLADSFWWQYKEEIHRLITDGLVVTLDTTHQGAGGTTRTLSLTPKGRLQMTIGRMETSGKL